MEDHSPIWEPATVTLECVQSRLSGHVWSSHNQMSHQEMTTQVLHWEATGGTIDLNEQLILMNNLGTN